MCQFHRKIFIVRSVLTVRPSSVTDNLNRRKENLISEYIDAKDQNAFKTGILKSLLKSWENCN